MGKLILGFFAGCIVIGLVWAALDTVAQKSGAASIMNTYFIDLVPPRPGTIRYRQMNDVVLTFCIEWAGREWNKHPERRFWLVKYLKAFCPDSITLKTTDSISINMRVAPIDDNDADNP